MPLFDSKAAFDELIHRAYHTDINDNERVRIVEVLAFVHDHFRANGYNWGIYLSLTENNRYCELLRYYTSDAELFDNADDFFGR